MGTSPRRRPVARHEITSTTHLAPSTLFEKIHRPRILPTADFVRPVITLSMLWLVCVQHIAAIMIPSTMAV
jgi:hypothetical protein